MKTSVPLNTMNNSSRYRAYTSGNIQSTPYWSRLTKDIQDALLVISQILPFKTNEYVLKELIDWDKVPDDPIFRLNFPHPDMLDPRDYAELHDVIRDQGLRKVEVAHLARKIRHKLNPHPAGQLSHNIPEYHGTRIKGVQHKYKQTVLFFPSAGQTCHAYCTFCFRWPQFINDRELRIEAQNSKELVNYLKEHTEVTDILITGGDPLTMTARGLSRFLQPLLDKELQHITSIRIGTKSLTYWPQRFVSDPDSDELLELFNSIVQRGKHLAVMAHINHPVELSTDIAGAAIRRITNSGAVIRSQSPVINHINNSSDIWIELWEKAINSGIIPYYMFIERDTGAQDYFKVPLSRILEIYKTACTGVSGLARTARGPVMSTFIGKVLVDGTVEINNERAFVLKLLQARRSECVGKIFLAKYNEEAFWLNDLVPFDEGNSFLDYESF